MDSVFTVLLFPVFAVISAFIAAMIGDRKGRSVPGFFLGLCFGPIGIAVVLAMKGNRSPCPHCRELIHRDASACPRCTRAIDDDGDYPALPSDNHAQRNAVLLGAMAVVLVGLWFWARSSSTADADTVPYGSRTPTGSDDEVLFPGHVYIVRGSGSAVALRVDADADASALEILQDGTTVCGDDHVGPWAQVRVLNHGEGVRIGWTSRRDLTRTAKPCHLDW